MFYPCPQLRLYFHDGNGHPLVGGKLKTFVSNSTIPIRTVQTYRNAEGTVLNPTEITLDERGECTVFLTAGVIYRFELYDSDGALVLEQDGISVASGSGSGGSTPTIAVESGSNGIDVQQTIMDSGVVLYTISAKKIEDAIEAEKNRAESAESALSKSIADETERATEAEKGLADAIKSEKDRAEGAESTLSKSIADETERAKEAEKGLADSIEAEKKRAEEAERTLSESISQETERAIAAEKASRTEIVAGDNITVEKTVGTDGQDVYTVSGEREDNLVDDVRVNGASVVTDKVANIDVPVAGTASPLMDGKVSVGNSLKYAREDHVHPTDTSRASASHTHGNIANGGTLQTNDITIANGDKLVVTDSSDSSKVARASISFDGRTTTKALTPKGTFEAFAKSGDITTAIQELDVSSVGGDGKYISAISETGGKISATATTMDTTPTANSTKAVTSGGIKTALNDKFDKYGFFGNTDGKWIGAALSVVNETEVKYWKLCSFTTGGWWTLNFVADVTNASFDSNVFERKIIAIFGSTPGVVGSALEIREGNNKLYSTRGYGNIIYYETSGNNVTIYIKAKFAANQNQFCRLVSVLSVNSISNLTWYNETTAGTQPKNPVKFSLGYKTVKPAGSTGVPVYIGSDGNPTACTDDFVHDGDVTSTYSSTGTDPVNGKAVAAAINAKGLIIKEISGEQVICFE